MNGREDISEDSDADARWDMAGWLVGMDCCRCEKKIGPGRMKRGSKWTKPDSGTDSVINTGRLSKKKMHVIGLLFLE